MTKAEAASNSEESVGGLIKKYMARARMRPTQLATQADIDKSYLSRIINDAQTPSWTVVGALETALKLSADEKRALEAAVWRRIEAGKTSPIAARRPKPPAASKLPPRIVTVGRGKELDEVMGWLAEGRWVINVHGEPGMGKTTLATELAYRLYAQGRTVLWLDVREGELGTPEELELFLWRWLVGGPPPTDQACRLVKLRQTIGRRRPILFLDNAEIAVGLQSAVTYLSQFIPPAAVVLTSRQQIPARLGDNYWLTELAVPDAIALFGHIGKRHGRQATTPEEQETIRTICQDMLQGHPGAIEIAAALWRSRPLLEILQGLRQRAMATLIDPLRADINGAMNLSIGLSYDLLEREFEPAWRLLPRLAVFAASFDLPAARAVIGEEEILLALDYLVTRSLVRFDGRRYSLHSVVREYGLDKLGEERWHFERRSVEYYLGFGEQHSSDYGALGEEKANLYASMDWCQKHKELQLHLRFYDILDGFLNYGGQWQEYLRRVQAALRTANRLKDPDESLALTELLGAAFRKTGQLQKARKCYERCLVLCKPASTLRGYTLRELALLAFSERDLQQARDLARQAARLLAKNKAYRMVWIVYMLLSMVAGYANRPRGVYWYAVCGLSAARASGVELDLGRALFYVFEACRAVQKQDEADAHLDELRALVDRTQEPSLEVLFHKASGARAEDRAEWEEAKDHYLAVLSLAKQWSLGWAAEDAKPALARVTEKLGQTEASVGCKRGRGSGWPGCD